MSRIILKLDRNPSSQGCIKRDIYIKVDNGKEDKILVDTEEYFIENVEGEITVTISQGFLQFLRVGHSQTKVQLKKNEDTFLLVEFNTQNSMRLFWIGIGAFFVISIIFQVLHLDNSISMLILALAALVVVRFNPLYTFAERALRPAANGV